MTGLVVPDIRTARLDLVSMSLAFMRALEVGDCTAASLEIGATFPPSLAEALRDFVGYRIPALEADPTSQPWLGRVMLERGLGGARTVVGTAGFHGPPDDAGRAELGYGVEPAHRRRGLATEVVAALLEWARGQGVDRFRATIAPTNTPSLAIVRAFGFREVGVFVDAVDGEELVFDLDPRGLTRISVRGAALTMDLNDVDFRRLPATRHLAVASDAMMSGMRADDFRPDLAFETLAVHAGAEPDEATGAVAPPIYQTSTYAQDGVNRPRGGYDYARTVNPTRDRLQRAVAALEGGGEGIAFASGSAATAAIAELAPPGSEIVVGDDVYGGTYRYLENVRRGNGVDARYANLAGDPDALWEAMTERTRLVWFETPTNPLLKMIDIGAAARAIRERFGDDPARPLLVVDNTFASPALQRPLDHGADISFHSATKYLAGHSDTVLGIAVTRDAAVAERLRFLQNAMGGVPGPFDCFLVLRGLRTLHLRVARHVENASAVADFLAGRDDIAWVSHPGLTEGRHAHPHAPAGAAQMSGGTGMVSFRPKADGPQGRSSAERAISIAEATRIFTLAESLGGVESLIEVPAQMTHMSVAGSPLQVPDDLVRLSVGIESATDLIADLRTALDLS